VTLARIFATPLVNIDRPSYGFADNASFADNVRCAARTETDE
jgi:hypothetical protein